VSFVKRNEAELALDLGLLYHGHRGPDQLFRQWYRYLEYLE